MRDDLDTMLDAMVSGGWAAPEIGSVDDLGHYALINNNGAASMVLELADQLDIAEPPADLLKGGWWIVRTDDQGFIHGTHYEAEPLAEWAEIEQMYEDFDDLTEA